MFILTIPAMKKIISKYISGTVVALAMTASLWSCDDFLTVRPKTEIPDYLLYANEDGFKSALTGAYVKMRANAYNPDGPMFAVMTMKSVGAFTELLACFHSHGTGTPGNPDHDFYWHEYTSETCEARIAHVYQKLYEIVANLNLTLKWIDDKDQDFLSNEMYGIIKGEALGLKALVMFDMVRIWGPMPGNAASHNREYIPYPDVVDKSVYPLLTYTAFMQRLTEDLDEAERLLKSSDPIVPQHNSDLNQGIATEDEWLAYRQNRMNYYAVCALKARVMLWMGNHDSALEYAKLVIGAQAGGLKQFDFMAYDDYSEKEDNIGFVETIFGMPFDKSIGARPASTLPAISTDMGMYGGVTLGYYGKHLQRVFPESTTNAQAMLASPDLRLAKQIIQTRTAGRPPMSPHTVNTDLYYKYKPFDNNFSKTAAIPILRLAEMYLIAAECSPSLSDAASYVNQLRTSRWDPAKTYTPVSFANEQEKMEWITGEYVREFWLEGQIFFCYKRMGLDRIPYPSQQDNPNAASSEVLMNEAAYVLPIPMAEITIKE